MFHYENGIDIPQQVEMNMIASSLSSFSSRIQGMHTYMSKKFPDLFDGKSSEPTHSNESLPRLLSEAHKAYGKADLIIFVKQPEERSLDQCHIEFCLAEKYGIHVERLTMKEIISQCKLVDSKLIYKEKVVSTVYFRAGYTPDDYPSQDEWDARLMIERSDAIKCPTVAYQLCGSKKIQQVLNSPKEMYRYLKDQSLVDLFSSVYTGIWELSIENKEVCQDACACPGKYVCKQQREGGGNLLFGDEMVHFLKHHKPEEMKQYILMKKIIPRPQPTIFVRNGVAEEVEGISELGIYGCFLSNGKTPIMNEYGGYLMRTKKLGVEDGGVLSGVMFLDSIVLV